MTILWIKFALSALLGVWGLWAGISGDKSRIRKINVAAIRILLVLAVVAFGTATMASPEFAKQLDYFVFTPALSFLVWYFLGWFFSGAK